MNEVNIIETNRNKKYKKKNMQQKVVILADRNLRGAWF